MHPFTPTCTDGSIHRPGSAPVYVLLFFGPVVNTLSAGIPFDHSLVVITGLMGETFDGDKIS